MAYQSHVVEVPIESQLFPKKDFHMLAVENTPGAVDGRLLRALIASIKKLQLSVWLYPSHEQSGFSLGIT
jgi:hypothetical protein